MILQRGWPLANVYVQRCRPLANEVLLEKGKTKGRLADAVVSWKSAGGNGVPAGLVNDGHHLQCVEHAVYALPIRYVEDSHLLWSRRA